ncbi:ABC transporter ATP-binding protein [Nocardioides sp. GY 10113]|uniref:ABC transporter ATP-binding protein n=1 Tax=Nocardioides sp. GY 10113 TaxID=2569761 RepID=UPI0010A93AD9|nr:ABC transporter ATP-binding protein [Nocardioides sp. GY 10113]TIC87719.1 ABC transporter ATP-binding protein [Nocardioides sp. GY 10113]
MIAVRGVSKVYALGSVRVEALRGVTLDVAAGEMVCIMGRSGSGKSTLLRQLGLIDRPTEGTIEIDGEEVSGLPERRRSALRLAKLGYVFQEYALLPELTAEENVYLPAMMRGGGARQRRAKARELLARVGLEDRARHRPKELSGGEQQRVAIARSLINDPVVLYADEPTANLDTASGRTVMEALSQLNRELGVTVLYVTHDPAERVHASREVHLEDGVLVGDGIPA